MYTDLKSALTTWSLNEKKIFLRADLNVPLDNGIIKDDTRIRALLPTVAYILNNGGLITLATHLDRPLRPDPILSTRQLLSWFARYGIPISFCAEQTHYHEHRAALTLIENLRFFKEEQDPRTDTVHNFVNSLTYGMDYYVEDAFATLHRHDSSITRVPKNFSHGHRTIGFLVERELHALQPLMNPKRPYVIIMGGGKSETKLQLVPSFIGKADTIILLPALSNNAELQDLCKQAASQGTQILLPKDYLISKRQWEGPYKYVNADQVDKDDFIIACGPESIKAFRPAIEQAKILLFNGPMGNLSYKHTIQELGELLRYIAQSAAYKVIGGGDTLAAAHYFGVAHRMDFCSTGGGALLILLAGKPVPGLDSLLVS